MELEKLRKEMDAADDQLLKLFMSRMDISARMAEYKAGTNKNVTDGRREREILNRVCGASGEELEKYTRILYSLLFDLSRSYQYRIISHDTDLTKKIRAAVKETEKLFPSKATAACQGVEGSYSQQACEKLFPLPEINYCSHFEGVYKAVEEGKCRYGILPIENSTYGSVNEVYDLMDKYHFYIAKSLRLRIDHHLLAKEGCGIGDITDIYSHEQALGQCSEFLKDLKDDVRVHVCRNTALAAKIASGSESGTAAAISSKACSQLYGLKVLSDEIQNTSGNYTRFICISKKMEIYPGADKISLMFRLPHKPGSLYFMISKCYAMGLNLTKIESRPIPGKDFEFIFYFDLDASIYDEDVFSLIGDMENSAEEFAFLGSYSEA